MLQFMGENKKLLNFHEQKFTELEPSNTNSQNFSDDHQCLSQELGNTNRATGPDPVESNERCFSQ